MTMADEPMDKLEGRVDRMEIVQATLAGLQIRLTDMSVEARRDTANTQRLWVRLCRKYGWLDDDDLTDTTL